MSLYAQPDLGVSLENGAFTYEKFDDERYALVMEELPEDCMAAISTILVECDSDPAVGIQLFGSHVEGLFNNEPARGDGFWPEFGMIEQALQEVPVRAVRLLLVEKWVAVIARQKSFRVMSNGVLMSGAEYAASFVDGLSAKEGYLEAYFEALKIAEECGIQTNGIFSLYQPARRLGAPYLL